MCMPREVNIGEILDGIKYQKFLRTRLTQHEITEHLLQKSNFQYAHYLNKTNFFIMSGRKSQDVK